MFRFLYLHMPKDGKHTKGKILAESRALILKNGFSGTSIDQILKSTGITKGAFFYHFKSKQDLAKALIEEFAREDMSHMHEGLLQTQQVIHDPLERVLQFVQYFIDMMSELEEPNPGCLYASYTYESTQFDQKILDYIGEMVLAWRETYERLLEDVLEHYNLIEDLDLKALADLPTTIFEGSFVLAKVLNEPSHTAGQLKLIKSYLKLLFVKKGTD